MKPSLLFPLKKKRMKACQHCSQGRCHQSGSRCSVPALGLNVTLVDGLIAKRVLGKCIDHAVRGGQDQFEMGKWRSILIKNIFFRTTRIHPWLLFVCIRRKVNRRVWAHVGSEARSSQELTCIDKLILPFVSLCYWFWSCLKVLDTFGNYSKYIQCMSIKNSLVTESCLEYKTI